MFRKEILKNGMVVEFHDQSNRYYGNYHRVYIEVRTKCELNGGLFSGAPDSVQRLEQTKAILGHEALSVSTLEKMGVEGEEVEATRDSLVESFVQTNFPYFENEDFPAKFVTRLFQEKSRKGRSFAL